MKTKNKFLNVNLDILSKEEVLQKCIGFFQTPGPKRILFLNAHCFNIAQKDEEYLKIINASDLLLNDGVGILLASKLLGIKIKENMNGTDLIPEILCLCKTFNKKVFILGDNSFTCSTAFLKLNKDCNICGFNNGFFKPHEEPFIIKKINRSKAELLLVGMGVPLQEKFIERNQCYLDNVKIIIAGGAIIKFLSGTVKRAPKWVRKIHMEWFHRLIIEPRRLWKRYLIGNFVFLWNVFYLNLINKHFIKNS